MKNHDTVSLLCENHKSCANQDNFLEHFGNMKIAFDIDGVVLQSIDFILDHINEEKGLKITPDELFTWDLDAIGVDSETLRKAILKMYTLPVVKSYTRAEEVLSLVHSETREPLLFITGRSDPRTAAIQLEKLPWNSKAPQMVVTGGHRYKMPYIQETEAEFIIEDDPEHLEAYLDAGIGVGLMVRPWNRNCSIPVNERFESWDDVEKWFLSLKQQT